MKARKGFKTRAISVVLLFLTGLLTLSYTQAPAFAVSPVIAVSEGFDFSCGLDASGVAKCWGDGTSGQLGDGNGTSSNTPVTVAGGFTFKSIIAGYNVACGLTNAGAAYCWGGNNTGAVGNGTTSQQLSPVAVNGGLTFTSLGGGSNANTMCGLISGGAAYCWGTDTLGQIGDGGSSNSSVPVAVSGGLSFKTISTNSSFTCALTTTGSPYCWGLSPYSSTPSAVSGGFTFSSLSTGRFQICALKSDGSAWCWGTNSSGQLGTGSTGGNNWTPQAVTGSHTFSTLASGNGHTCGIDTSGASWCWGTDSSSQLGDGGTTNQSSPVATSGGYKYNAVSGGADMTCAVTNGGGLMCWGDNASGQNGNGVYTGSNTTPVTVFWFAVTSNDTASVTVDPTFTFSVGSHTGACNGVSQTSGVSSSATSVALGHLTSAANVFGAQDITVSTNSGSGYTVFISSASATLSDGHGHTIAAVAGSNSAPGAFPSGGTASFGYTTSDSSLGTGTVDRFTNPSAAFAALSTTPSEVAYNSSSVSSDITCVGYEVGAAASTPAASYSSTVVYNAVPVF